MYGALSACQRLQQANRFQEHDVTRCIVGLGGHLASIHQALSTCSTNANSSSITTKDQYQSMKFCNLAFNRQYSYQSVSHWLSMGRSCCVINCTNKSHDYKGVLLNNGFSFHRFPGVKTHQGSDVHLLTTRRRRAWVAAVRRVNITFEHIPSSMYVCSRHFHGGKFVQNLFDHPPIPTHLAFCLFLPAHSPRPQCSETWTWPLNEQHINDSSCTFDW